jgi:hypothetical protein
MHDLRRRQVRDRRFRLHRLRRRQILDDSGCYYSSHMPRLRLWIIYRHSWIEWLHIVYTGKTPVVFRSEYMCRLSCKHMGVG